MQSTSWAFSFQACSFAIASPWRPFCSIEVLCNQITSSFYRVAEVLYKWATTTTTTRQYITIDNVLLYVYLRRLSAIVLWCGCFVSRHLQHSTRCQDAIHPHNITYRTNPTASERISLKQSSKQPTHVNQSHECGYIWFLWYLGSWPGSWFLIHSAHNCPTDVIRIAAPFLS